MNNLHVKYKHLQVQIRDAKNGVQDNFPKFKNNNNNNKCKAY